MKSSIYEVAEDVYRLTLKADNAPLQFNHFLVNDDEPMLMHMGHLATFDYLQELVSRIIPVHKIRHLCFSHVESDESGAVAAWFDVAAHSEITVGPICHSSVKDFAPKRSRPLSEGGSLCLGEKTLQILETPHMPHNWDACLFYLLEDKVLFSSDLGTQFGDCPPFTTEDPCDIIVSLQKKLGYMPLSVDVLNGIRRIQTLEIETMAVMHGSSLSASQSKKVLAAVGDDLQQQMRLSLDCSRIA